MVCMISEDGNLSVCGGMRGRKFYFFTKNWGTCLFCDSLWYEPNLVAKRKTHERIDLFIARVTRKLGFRPRTMAGWWQFVAVPQLKAGSPLGK